MTDAGARRNNTEIFESLLAPLQESVALAIALIFTLNIRLECTRTTEMVDHNRMVDNEINRNLRIDR